MKHANWLKLLLNAVILAGLAYAASEYLSGKALMHAFRSFDSMYVLPIVALGLIYTLVKGWRFVWLLRPVCDLSSGVCMRAYWSGEAATLLPGGVAARAGLLKEVNVPVHRSSAPIILSSILDQVLFLAATLVAALWYEEARRPVLIILAVLAAGGALFAMPVVRATLGRGVDRVATRFRVEQKWRNFINAMRETTGMKLLLVSLAITALSFVIKVLALDLCLRALGHTLPYAATLFAFVLPTLLGRLTPVPAGVGVTEAGMVGFLVTNSNVGAEEALAASAVFRIATVFLPALLGSFVYFFAWRGAQELTRPQKG